MKMALEAKYVSPEAGLSTELTWANNPESLEAAVRQITARDDLSDLVIVNIDALPEPARESWEERA